MEVIVDHIGKSYEGSHGQSVVALEDINLTVHEEEFVVLVGPSGCDKSTLLNLIGGLLDPSSGRIYFEGVAENRDPNIGMFFQDVGLFPRRTVAGNIAFGLEEAGLSEAERRATSFLFLSARKAQKLSRINMTV